MKTLGLVATALALLTTVVLFSDTTATSQEKQEPNAKRQGRSAEPTGTPKPTKLIPYRTTAVQELRYQRGHLRANDPNDALLVVFFSFATDEKKAFVEDLKWLLADKKGKIIEPVATCFHVGEKAPVIIGGQLEAGAVALISDKKEPLLGLVFLVPKENTASLVLIGPYQRVSIDRMWAPSDQHAVHSTKSGWWTFPPIGRSLVVCQV